MQSFVFLLKSKPVAYTLVISAMATVISVNEIIGFRDKTVTNLPLMFVSITLFSILVYVALKNELWK